jgi:membrane-associated protease RseP (regulator of RpoE activity)
MHFTATALCALLLLPAPATAASRPAAPRAAAGAGAVPGHQDRPTLGVSLDVGGGPLRVLAVEPGGAAAAAGLLPGDLLIGVRGGPLLEGERGFEALAEAIRAAGVGGAIELGVERGAERLLLRAIVGTPEGAVEERAGADASEADEPPSAPPAKATEPDRAYLGVELADGADGALVAAVLEDTAASRAGLLGGDLVVAFGGRAVGDGDDLIAQLRERSPGARVELVVLRDGDRLEFEVELGRWPGGGTRAPLTAGTPDRPRTPADAGRSGAQVEREELEVEAVQPLAVDLERLFDGLEGRLEGAFGALERDLEGQLESFERDFGRSLERFSMDLERMALDLAQRLTSDLVPLIERAVADGPREPLSPERAELPELIQLRAELDVARAERDAANARVVLLEQELTALRVEVRELIRAVEALRR